MPRRVIDDDSDFDDDDKIPLSNLKSKLIKEKEKKEKEDFRPLVQAANCSF